MFLLNLLLTATMAHAAPFGKMTGTYQITDCKLHATNTNGNQFCRYDKLSIGVDSVASYFYFFNVSDSAHPHEVVSFPLSPKSIGYNYQEVSDTYAAITRILHTGNSQYDYHSAVSLMQMVDESYLLVYQSDMPAMNEHQSFEIHLQKISTTVENPPTMPPDPDDGD